MASRFIFERGASIGQWASVVTILYLTLIGSEKRNGVTVHMRQDGCRRTRRASSLSSAPRTSRPGAQVRYSIPHRGRIDIRLHPFVRCPPQASRCSSRCCGRPRSRTWLQPSRVDLARSVQALNTSADRAQEPLDFERNDAGQQRPRRHDGNAPTQRKKGPAPWSGGGPGQNQ